MKVNFDKQAVKFTPTEGDGALALRLFSKVWPEKFKDGKLKWRLPDRTLTYDGESFVLRIKKAKRMRDDKTLKYEMNRSLEVFNMLLTMRLPIYSCPEFRTRVRAVQDELGHKFVNACYHLRHMADELPEAKHSAKWGYENALITVNKEVKPAKEPK